MGSSSLREELFETHLKVLSEAEREREREKRCLPFLSFSFCSFRAVASLPVCVVQNREERSLKDREREVRRDSERRHVEVRAGRGAYQKEEGTRVFRAMLVDFARTHEMTFEQVERKMKNDSRWDQCSLGTADMEDLFTEHLAVLHDKVKRGFFAALDSLTQGNLEMTWADILRDHPEIKDDPRFLRLSTHPDTRTTEAPSLFAQFSREKVPLFLCVNFFFFLFPQPPLSSRSFHKRGRSIKNYSGKANSSHTRSQQRRGASLSR